MRRRSHLAAATAAVFLSVVTPLASSAQVPRVVVATGVGIAEPTRDVPSDLDVEFRIVLRPAHQSVLDSLLASQRNPASEYFHRYLTAAEFSQNFQPSRSEIDQIASYFHSYGVTIQPIAGTLLLRGSGTARSVESSLRTDIRRSERGTGLIVAHGDVTLPSSLASRISGIVGLSRTARAHHHTVGLPRASTSPISTCAGAEASSGLTAHEQAALYGIDQLWTTGSRGVGHTIALYELAQYRTSDLATFFTCYGISPALTNTSISGGASGYDAEVALDIQQAGVLAPGATLAVYSAPNDNTGPVDLFAKIAADNTADIVSISWGICESSTDSSAEAPIFQQMAAQGQTVLAATGDAGSSDCQPVDGTSILSVDDPASQPYVTAVGGTYVTSFSPFHERVWNDGSGAGGGGVSSVFARPSWQVAPGIDSGTMREIPDLALTADPRVGFPTFYAGHWATFGGTSIGAPILSGLLAVAAQNCGTSRFGFLNPMLYEMARRGIGFRDVTDGSNDLFNTGSYSAATGYDMASGLGSPDPASFAAALCPSQPSPDTTTLTSSTSNTADQLVTLDLALRDVNGSLLATTIPTVTATQSAATPIVTVLPPIVTNATHRIVVVTDRPGVVTVSVAVGGAAIASLDVTVTSPVTTRNVTAAVAALRATGLIRSSTTNSNVVMVGQRSDGHIVITSSNSSAVRDLTVLTKMPLASSNPDIDCWRSLCSVTYRANNKLIVISNALSNKPKALALNASVGSASQPRIAVLGTGSAASYVTTTGRLVVTMVSDAGSFLRSFTLGTNLRGTPEITRTAQGRVRVVARTTKGLTAFTNTSGNLMSTAVVLSKSNLTSGPFLVSTSPETILAMSVSTLVTQTGAEIGVTTSSPVPIFGIASGLALTIDDGVLTLWCSTPTWRSLDPASTLGITLTTPRVVGTGDAVIVSSGSFMWAVNR